jgi:hypothetical protein
VVVSSRTRTGAVQVSHGANHGRDLGRVLARRDRRVAPATEAWTWTFVYSSLTGIEGLCL